MSFIRKKYSGIIRIVDSLLESIINIDKLKFTDKSEVLILLKELKISSSFSKKQIRELAKMKTHNLSLVNIFRRYLVLITYGLNVEERKQTIKYWLYQKNYRKIDNVFMQASALQVLTEDIDLLSKEAIEEIKKSQLKRVSELESTVSLAWLTISLGRLKLVNQQREIVKEIFKSRENNGSWGNNFDRTIRILLPISQIQNISKKEFRISLNYIKKRLSQNISISVESSSQLLRLLFSLGNFEEDLITYMNHEIEERELNKFHMIEDSLVKLKLDEVFSELRKYCKMKNLKEDLINCESRWNEITKKKLNNMDSVENIQVETNRIVISTYDLINRIKKG